MKVVKGKTWEEAHRSRDFYDNIGVLLQVCAAVSYAHRQGVLHRDLRQPM